MRPIDELPEEIARALEGVVLDLDDTVTREGVVEVEAYQAIAALERAGLARIVLTGRPSGWAEVLATLWPIDLAVAENGACWWSRQGRRVAFGRFESDPEVIASSRRRLDAVIADVRARMPAAPVSSDTSLRVCDVAFDIGEEHALPVDEVRALETLILEHGMRTTTSSVHVHAITGGWDKAEGAVRALGEVLGIDRERARERFLFVGDSGNDAAAFAFFSATAGVSNVGAHLASLPTPPRWIASRDRGKGFAEIVDTVLAKRGVAR
jgi:HAD superfamily hydrolase (TIGR01484 family)